MRGMPRRRTAQRRRFTALLPGIAALALVGTALSSGVALPAAAAATAAPVTKVLTIVEENHSLTQMQAGMPYLLGLATRFAYATGYTAVTHPSEPNYLAIAGGSTFGDTADHNPAYQVSGHSVFGQAVGAGRTAAVYAESMISPCQHANSTRYAARHNPWTSFRDESALCTAGDHPMGTTVAGALIAAVKAGTLPDAGMLVPNLCNDAHDCAIGTADAWLKAWLPKIMAGPDFVSGRLAVVVTADEDDHHDGNKVLTVVLNQRLDGRHLVVTSPLSHYSLTGFYDAVLGTPMIRSAATSPSFRQAFGLG